MKIIQFLNLYVVSTVLFLITQLFLKTILKEYFFFLFENLCNYILCKWVPKLFLFVLYWVLLYFFFLSKHTYYCNDERSKLLYLDSICLYFNFSALCSSSIFAVLALCNSLSSFKTCSCLIMFLREDVTTILSL